MIASRTKGTLGLLMIVLTLPLFAMGCQRLRSSSNTDFLKPLATTSTAKESSKPQGPMPSERKLCIETAQTVAAKGHFREAIELLEKAESLEPKSPKLDAELAALYAQAGKLEKAVERYQRAIQAKPKDLELRNNFAWTLMEANRHDEAIGEVRKGIELAPDNRRLRSTLAVLMYRQGDRNAAWEQFRDLYGESAAHHNLALLDIDAGDLATAQSHLDRAMANNPSATTRELKVAFETSVSQISTR